MSDTPRTDAEELPHSLDDHHFVVGSFFARKLERELNEANDRIKRLEEALYKIEFYAATGILQDSFDEIKRIAKEAKL
jgi:hypothetical protein